MICRLCLNTLDEQNAVLLFTNADNEGSNDNKTIPENYLVQLISTHLYLCLSRDDAISTSICTDCCAQLESFHNFWKLVEHKQTTLCSQFLEIDCDVNWSEEGDVEQQQQYPMSIIDYEQDPDPELEPEAGTENTPAYDVLVKEETEFHETYYKVDPKVVAAHKFPCMFCEKSFKMRRYLEEHVATHTGDRPIACAYCNMAFRCRSNMYTHVKTKHTTQWQKARAERESAKINSNNNVQIQRTTNGDNNKFVDALTVPQGDLKTNPPQPKIKKETPATPTTAPTYTPVNVPTALEESPPIAVSIKCEPMEAINLTVAKPTCPMPVKRITRSSRRKTHLPKKVQNTPRSGSASEDNSNDGGHEVEEKRLKPYLTSCKEEDLLLANYNAVAAVVAAATQQQQHLCATIMQQHQEHMLTAMSAGNTSTSTSSAAAAAAAAAAASVALTSQNSTTASAPAPAHANVPAPALPPAEPYTCNICGQQLRNQRALKNHLHNKHNATSTQSSTSTSIATSTLTPSTSSPNQAHAIFANCGELSGHNHRCLSKAKYACDVCGKSFKMKRYLEEHFATHTGVKLHTCAFCPTEFRSKSNMYHHTKRKHKIEWERSRASRNAAKSAAGEQQPEQDQEQHEQLDETVTNS